MTASGLFCVASQALTSSKTEIRSGSQHLGFWRGSGGSLFFQHGMANQWNELRVNMPIVRSSIGREDGCVPPSLVVARNGRAIAKADDNVLNLRPPTGEGGSNQMRPL